MENKLGDTIHCDDKLKTTLHCDDKDKLRRKLALLQREYLRTAQRLKRAERLDAVRSHVRSRITEQELQDQRGPAVPLRTCPTLSSPSLTLDTHTRMTPGSSRGQEQTGGPVHSDHTRKDQVIRFVLPSDGTCPLTPDPGLDPAGGHRPSPALRLRSRRSRLRWERRRGAEAGGSTDNSEEGQEMTEGVEGELEREKTEEMTVVNESEELLAVSETQSSSLLLSHWSSHGHAGAEEMEGKERQSQEQREEKTELGDEENKESPSLLLKCWNPAMHAEGGRQNGINSTGERTGGGEEDEMTGEGQIRGKLCEENGDKDAEQNAREEKEGGKNDRTMEIRDEKNEGPEKGAGEHDGEGGGLLTSCTLVEGLLFPAEYYVRTTRRMTFSHSQPDMHAVILSQLTGGRQRRGRGRGSGRGRGRVLNRHAHQDGLSDPCTQTDFSSVAAARASLGSHKPSHVQADTSDQLTNNSQSSSGMSDQISANQTNTDACSPFSACAVRPARGRKRKRGRGRGRGRGRALSSQCCLSLDSSHLSLGQSPDDLPPTSTTVSSSLPLLGGEGPDHSLISEDPAPPPNPPQPPSTHTSATQPSSGVGRPESSPASGCLENVYPIFQKKCSGTKKPPEMNTNEASWLSLLLPSSPSPPTPLLPLPSLPPFVNNLASFDFQQDFHLPDDQFASLKLHKLRQVTTAVEHLTPPSHNTRSSLHAHTLFSSSSSEKVMSLSLPLSLTPTIANSLHPTEERQPPVESKISAVHQAANKLTDKPSMEDPSIRSTTDNPGDTQLENLHECRSNTRSTESKSHSATNEQDTMNLSRTTTSDIHKPVDRHFTQQPDKDCPALSTEHFAGKMMNYLAGQSNNLSTVGQSSTILTEKQTDSAGVIHHLEEQRFTNQTELRPVNKTFSCSPQETSEGCANNCSVEQTGKDVDAPGERPASRPNVKCPAKGSSKCLTEDSSDLTMKPPRARLDPAKCPPHPAVCSQLLLSPALPSPPRALLTPHLASTLSSSPRLPSLGVTPHPVTAALPLTPSPPAPALTLPPSHSPTTRALSPPTLSPCLSLTPLPTSLPPAPCPSQIQASSDPSVAASQCQMVIPGTCPPEPSIQMQDTGGAASSSMKNEGGNGQTQQTEMAEECIMRCTHTLKAPAGDCLVDACCLPGPSGGLCVAAAGKWAVCVWKHISTSDWSLMHTWTFDEPVISVFPVPDAAGVVCVTLGQLEIREVRMLSCSSGLQVLLCEGVVQAVVGVAKSRVVSSSHSVTSSTLQLFTLSEDDSAPISQPLTSPGVCVEALAAVDGLSDALIGSAEGGHLFVWNLRTGQLLQRIILRDSLAHTACLRGYTYCGVLFVLLQHQLLSSLEEEEKEARKTKNEMFSMEDQEEERTKPALISLVAVNPVNGKSALATRLCTPKTWSGRLCEVDVLGSSVVGLSQSGSVFVWELGVRGGSRLVWAPETEGWQLARWGGQDTLMTGHHNGDLILHRYTCVRD